MLVVEEYAPQRGFGIGDIVTGGVIKVDVIGFALIGVIGQVVRVDPGSERRLDGFIGVARTVSLIFFTPSRNDCQCNKGEKQLAGGGTGHAGGISGFRLQESSIV